MQHIVPHLTTLIAASLFAGLALTAVVLAMVFFSLKKVQRKEIRVPPTLIHEPLMIARDSPVVRRHAEQRSWSNTIQRPITAAFPSERTQFTSHLPTQIEQNPLPNINRHSTQFSTHETSHNKGQDKTVIHATQQAGIAASDQSCFEFLITSNEAHCAFATDQSTAISSMEASVHAMSDLTHDVQARYVQPNRLRLVRRCPNATRPSTMHDKISSMSGVHVIDDGRSSDQVRRTKSLDHHVVRQQPPSNSANDASLVHANVKTIKRHPDAPPKSSPVRGGLRISSASLPQLWTTTLSGQPTMFSGSKSSSFSVPFESVTEASTFKKRTSDDSYGDEHVEVADFSLSRCEVSRRRSVNSITGSERGHLRIVTDI